MSGRKLISFMLAFMMLFGLSFAWAEGSGDAPDRLDVQAQSAAIPETVYYQGGVVFRTVPRGASDSDLIQLAYSLTDMPYIVLDKPYEWEIFVTGGSEPYEITALLAWQESLDMDQFNDPWSTAEYYVLPDTTAAHTFTEAGRYFWQFMIEDSEGQSVTFQTRTYEAYSEADETDTTTTVGKINSIIASLITDDMSDYSRARVLHDWIIYNANYDYTYTNYDASGVLLHGSGVCDSYARAYLMLCTAAGLECMYVSGTAGHDPDPEKWGNHGWNLVKLDGSWYHVDCTWDDPNEGGGFERHTYFCVDDETMAKDHRWNQPDDLFDHGGMVVPDAEGGQYEHEEDADGDYDFTFATWDEFDEKFDEMVARGERREKTYGLYIGDEAVSDVYADMAAWSSEKMNELGSAGLITGAGRGYRGSLFYYQVLWVKPTGYLRINEDSMIISVGETGTVAVTEMYPVEDSFTWTSSDPSVATVSGAFDANASSLVVSVTGVGHGSATITGTAPDGHTDSMTVTVVGPYTPVIDIQFEEISGGVTVTWDGVPGVTEYQVVRSLCGEDTVLATTSETEVALTAEQLSPDVPNEVYIIARRKVAGSVAATYISERCAYGEMKIEYAATLPEQTIVIEAEAFLDDKSLTSVSIPDGVKRIGSAAFSGCASLTTVRIPDSVVTIAEDAFSGCPLAYVVVVEGSYADNWMQEHFSDAVRIYE